MSLILSLLLLTVSQGFLVKSPLCVAKDFYVTPDPNNNTTDQSCPPPCYSIEQYAQNDSLFSNHTNISIIFLPGTHHFHTHITISGSVALSLQALRTEQLNEVIVIAVSANSSILLIDTVAVTIDRLSLKGVTITLLSPMLLSIESSYWVKSSLKIQTYNITQCHVQIVESTFQGDNAVEIGVEIAGTNVNLNINNSSILQYRQNGLRFLGSGETRISNVTLFNNPNGLHFRGPQSISINNSTIRDSNITGIFLIFSENVLIKNTNFTNNHLGLLSICSSLHIEDLLIAQNNIGMGILPPINEQVPVNETSVMVYKCTFFSNRLIGMGLIDVQNQQVAFEDCNFYDNEGTALLAYQSNFDLLKENTFINNIANRGGGLALYNSTVMFGPGSNTTFINNTAREYGGAIYTASLMFLETNTFITGQRELRVTNIDGVSSITDYFSSPCFYYKNQLDNNSQVTFTGNNAQLGGMDIYGLTHRSYVPELQCTILNNSMFQFDDELIPSTLQIASDPTRVCFCDSHTSCCQERIILLNEVRYPGETFKISVVAVGFNFGLVTGRVYTTAKGGELADSNQFIQRADKQCSEVTYRLVSNQTVSTVLLTLTSQEQFTNDDSIQEKLDILNSPQCDRAARVPCVALLNTPIYVNVTLEDCPLGFQLSNARGVCDCDQNIASLNRDTLSNMTCQIQNRTGIIDRQGRVWMGVDINDNNTDVYYWHNNCPNNYCNRLRTHVNLLYPETQCTLNRDGVLCGKCQQNYSLQLGGNRCIQCDDHYLALVIVFAILGILLVGFIKILNLTVADGTVNGLIFYANVVWRNNAIFFSSRQSQNIGYYIITVPIAWINLDFGIETCFSESLDQLTKTGLQFIFPVYIWCIAGFIILLSHYSTRATKLLGSNSVAVLATLLLLSYGKVLQNITDIFTFTNMYTSNNAIRTVWSLDGNVLYGVTPGHARLITVACFFLVFFIVPFTMVLFVVPFIRTKSHHRPLHWISTMKPFLDAFYGPFNDRRRYHVWPGILLLSRMVILIVFSTISTYSPNGSILLMILIATLLLLYTELLGQLYKKRYLAQHENLYIINLNILAGVSLFYQTIPLEARQSYELNPAAASSICIALIQFTVVLLHSRRKKVILFSKKIVNMLIMMTKNRSKHEEVVDSTKEHKLTPTSQELRITYDPTRVQETLLEISDV